MEEGKGEREGKKKPRGCGSGNRDERDEREKGGQVGEQKRKGDASMDGVSE